MLKVYLVVTGFDAEYSVDKVFLNKEQAEKYAAEMCDEITDYWVEERVVIEN